jgi:hypothetical protein
MEEKVYKSNKISLDLLKEIKRMEYEYGFYYPGVKSDKIDQLLAAYINSTPERPALKSLFVREAEGVYSFGSKKTNIKAENGLLKVRVGGGWLSIQEFVDQYLPIEYEKQGYGSFAQPVMGSPEVSPKRGGYSPGRQPSPNTRNSTKMR